MKEYQDISEFKSTNGTVVTIGTFDGVHIGHRAILTRMVEAAHNNNLEAVLLTFFPHPRMVLQNDDSLKLLNTLDEKKKLLSTIGIDHLVIHPFTKEFSRLTAVEYVRDILVNQLHAKKIIIGYDHRFGRNRTADISDLREYGATYHFDVEEISAKELNDVTISSTKIRNALLDGDIETANSYLGYAFSIYGTIVPGKGIGKTMGYPTANLKVTNYYKLIPKHGVYITQATIDGSICHGITSIGTNPTVGGSSTTIETYFMDLDQDLYERPIALEFLSWIREEKTFQSVEELQQAISEDELKARMYLSTHG